MSPQCLGPVGLGGRSENRWPARLVSEGPIFSSSAPARTSESTYRIRAPQLQRLSLRPFCAGGFRFIFPQTECRYLWVCVDPLRQPPDATPQQVCHTCDNVTEVATRRRSTMNPVQENVELRSEVSRLRQLLQHHGLPCDNPAGCSPNMVPATVTESLTMPLASACMRHDVTAIPPQHGSSATVAGGGAGFEASHGLSKAQVERYSRQLLLPSFGLAAQEGVCSSSVLIVGCGGLGSPAALYLAASGIGGCQAPAL